MFAIGHLNKRIREVCLLSGLLLGEPDFMETLPADAAAQMRMQLLG